MTPIQDFRRLLLDETFPNLVYQIGEAELGIFRAMDSVFDDFDAMGCPDGVTDKEYADSFVYTYRILTEGTCPFPALQDAVRRSMHFSLTRMSEVARLPECPYRSAAETIRKMS